MVNLQEEEDVVDFEDEAVEVGVTTSISLQSSILGVTNLDTFSMNVQTNLKRKHTMWKHEKRCC